MASFSALILLLQLIVSTILGDINPFMDTDLFKISWAGPTEVELDKGMPNHVVVMTNNKEKYQCILPDESEGKEGLKKDYSGQTPQDLINQLFSQSSCSYRIESYWTYELCHGKHLRQYHESKEAGQKPKLQEYYLGLGKPDALDASDSDSIKIRKVEGISLPYFQVNLTDGTKCDLTQSPRKTRILYVCQPEGRGEIYEFKETSTCEYEVMVLTSVLCVHPDFRPKNAPVGEIQCHAVEGSPSKPRQLRKLEKDEEVKAVYQDPPPRTTTSTPDTPLNTGTTLPPQYVEAAQTLGSNTDKQLLREFLAGDHCLKGGSGWWKYEFCYGKYARQYHDDSEGRTVINLGIWRESTHLAWLEQNKHKRPKEIGKRRFISQYYSKGDTCDLTGLPRTVEVKLKCVTNTNHPHSVGIYLMEPTSCSYVLGVESPIFCSLIDKADENGLLKHIEI